MTLVMVIGCADFFKFYSDHLTEAENNTIGGIFFDNMSKIIYKTPEKRHSNFGREDGIMSIKTPFGY